MRRFIDWFQIITFTVLCLFVFTGCEGPDLNSDPINESEIFGKYVANYNNDRLEEYIELRKDSVYIHYTKYDNLVYNDTGSYKYWRDLPYNDYIIDFDRNFVRRFPQTFDKYNPFGDIDTTSSRGRITYI